MSESSIKSQFKTNEKNNRKFSRVLRCLAKSDTSLINKMNVTVYKEDIIEEKKQFLVAPLMYINCHKRFINHNSTENTSINIFENSITEEIQEIQSPQDPELMDYPDSSDFDDDE